MDTRPGDLMGPDSHGELRISREIPLPWLVGIVFGLFVQAAAVWFGQQQITKDVVELKTTIRQASDTLAAMTGKDIEHSLKIIEMDRRINALEVKAGKL